MNIEKIKHLVETSRRTGNTYSLAELAKEKMGLLIVSTAVEATMLRNQHKYNGIISLSEYTISTVPSRAPIFFDNSVLYPGVQYK